MDPKEIHDDLLNFLEISKLIETTFEFKGEKSINKVSLNGYYSKDIIDTIISCLFQKGFDNLINSISYKSLKGVYEIDQIVHEYIGRLKQELANINFIIDSKEIIESSIIEKRVENFNIGHFKEQVNSYMSYDEFLKMMSSKFKMEVLKMEEVKKVLIQKFAESKSKVESDFKIESEIIDKFFPSIFEDLKNSNHFEGNYRDFEKLMSGLTPKDKIGIKEITSMGTFINWLISVKLIPKKIKRKIDWKFIADNLYIIGNKENLLSTQFSKNGTRHHNNDIYSNLLKHEAVIKSHLSQ